MASSAVMNGGSSGPAAARKQGRAGGARSPSSAARARLAAGGGGLHRAMGWVGVRERLWGGYAAEIRIPSSRKRVWIGRFEHAMQAALAYDAAMFLFYGRDLPKLRRYNFPDAPRPSFPEFVRRALTVANVKAIADEHARNVVRFAPIPPPVIPAPPPAAAAPAAPPLQVAPPVPLQVAEAGGAAAAGAGGGTAIEAAAAGAATPTVTADARDIYIDADILTGPDCQFPGGPIPDEDFVRLMDMDVDVDLIFGDL